MSVKHVERPGMGAQLGVLVCIGVELVIGVGMALAGSSEGWLGGLLFGALYAAPLGLLLVLLRSPHPALVAAAGLLAVPLAFAYVALPIGNWSGYHGWEAARAVAATLPAVAGCFLAFAAGVPMRRH